jgi:Ca2+-binding EF-hand superfamily protein
MSRLDYGGVVERRFRRLDRNADDYLSRSEMSKRLAGRFDEIDANKDGRISNEEWSGWMLARFDRQDANHDGTVTSDERERARAAREMDLPTPAEEPVTNATSAAGK